MFPFILLKILDVKFHLYEAPLTMGHVGYYIGHDTPVTNFTLFISCTNERLLYLWIWNISFKYM
jgi:hypothetical protein